MAQILVRKLDDALLAKVKRRAKANGRSAESEVREIIAMAFDAPSGPHRPLVSFIGSVTPGRTQDEIDKYVRSLRDEWER